MSEESREKGDSRVISTPVRGCQRRDRVAALARRGAVFAVYLIATALIIVPSATGAPARQRGSIGTGVGATPLQLTSTANPGGRYSLPSLYIVNTGSRVSVYAVRVERIGHLSGHDVPPSWLRLGRTTLRLRPHQHAFVPVRLILPRHAAGGDYRTDLVVGTTTRRPTRGAALGAAAADQLAFTIATPGFPWSSPWLIYPLLAAAVIGLAALTVRRAGLRIEIERRR